MTNEKYNKLKLVVWDNTFPIYSHLTDKFYMDFDDILDDIDEFNEDNETNITSEDLMFVRCNANEYPQIDYDSMLDDVPEDFEDIPKELRTKIDELNEYIKTLPPLSYSYSNLRIELIIEL